MTVNLPQASLELKTKLDRIEQALIHKNGWITASLEIKRKDRNIFCVAFRLFVNLFSQKYYQDYQSSLIAAKLLTELKEASLAGPLDVALVDQAQRIINIFHDRTKNSSRKDKLKEKKLEIEAIKPAIYLRLRTLANEALRLYKENPSDLTFEQNCKIIEVCFESLRENEGKRKAEGNELVTIAPILHEIKKLNALKKLNQLKQDFFGGESVQNQIKKYQELIKQAKFKKNPQIENVLKQWLAIACESKNRDYFAGNLSFTKLIEFRTKLDEFSAADAASIREEINKLKNNFHSMIEDFIDYLSGHHFILFYDFLELNDFLRGSKAQIQYCQNEFARLQKLTKEILEFEGESFTINFRSAKLSLLTSLLSENEELFNWLKTGSSTISFDLRQKRILASAELAHRDSTQVLMKKN